MATLCDLKPGQNGRVISVRGDEALRHRLMELGLTPGVHVTLFKTAPLGDPIEILLRGYSLSLRRAQAALVEIA